MDGIPDLEAFGSRLTLKPQQELFAYWRSIFPVKGWPGRQHFDPVDIPHLLRMLALVDVVRDNGTVRYRFRLLGTDLTTRAGRDMTGRWMEECFP